MSVRFCGVGTSRAQSLGRSALPRATRNAQFPSGKKEGVRRRGSGTQRLREERTLIQLRCSDRPLASYDDSDNNEDPTPPRQSNRRVLLKISGEALQGTSGRGISPEVLRAVANEIARSWKEGYQVAVVVGGGNFFRGAEAFEGIDRVTADNVGMLATTMNALFLQSMLESCEVPTRIQTGIEIRQVAEPFIRRRAIRHLEKHRVVIFGAGTGNPFFTTDMAAALRAAEIDADEILKATKVEGIYEDHPDKNPNAKLLPYVTFDRALSERLAFMDHTAMSLCRDRNMPVRVFSLLEPGNIHKAIRGDPVGTKMGNGDDNIEEKEVMPFVGPMLPVNQLNGRVAVASL